MRLHHFAVLAAALVTSAAAVATASGAPPSATAPPHSTLGAEIRRTLAAGAPGVIAFVDDGRAVRLRAAGLADTRTGRRLRPTDRFRAGSTTKPFVATVILQLVAEGRMSLTDTVERWLPGILPYGAGISVRQLLNHTSGIPDDQDAVDAEFIAGNMTRSWTPRELVALVAGKAPDFAAGTAWNYSNTNYALAGLIVERVTGQRLGAEIGRRIIRPLHLRHTTFPVNASTFGGSHAHGYATLGAEIRDVTVLNPSGTWGAGNLVSTVGDLARFWRALLGGRLLAPAQLAAMQSTVPIAEGAPQRYGLGLIMTPSECGRLWGHGGDIAGYSNAFFTSEDGKRQAAVVTTINPAPEALNEQIELTKHAAVAAAVGTRGACHGR